MNGSACSVSRRNERHLTVRGEREKRFVNQIFTVQKLLRRWERNTPAVLLVYIVLFLLSNIKHNGLA